MRVLDRHGFGTVEAGQLLTAAPDGDIAGAVLRGVLDRTVVPLAIAEATGAPPITRERARRRARRRSTPASRAAAAPPCSPTRCPPRSAAALGAALERGQPAALASTADGAAALVLTGPELADVHGSLGTPDRDRTAVDTARNRLRRGATVTERVAADGADLLLDLWVPVPSVLVVGRGRDRRRARRRRPRSWAGRPGASPASTRRSPPSPASPTRTCSCCSTTTPAFDAVLADGLRHGRGFLGALGSRHTQAARRERLLAAGLTDDDLAALHGPVGLDLGARTPAETAVSIVAQVIAHRAGRSGAALAATEGRIGG